MAEVERKDLAVRTNMARLRALREAEAANRPPADPVKTPRKAKSAKLKVT
jgi:hypothetical protein